MPKLYIETEQGGTLLWCPACDMAHRIVVSHGEGGDGWRMTGPEDSPSISPSILVRWTYGEEVKRVCHSFVRNGVWQYLNDCTHEFAGKELPMVALPDDFL